MAAGTSANFKVYPVVPRGRKSPPKALKPARIKRKSKKKR